jgi:hypothetical protein
LHEQKLLNAAMRWLDEFNNDIAVLKSSMYGLNLFMPDLTIRFIIWQAQR